MAYYCQITGVTRISLSMCNVTYEVHNKVTDAVTNEVTDTVMEMGDYNLPFETVGTAAERRAAIRKKLTDHFDDVVGRAKAAEKDFAVIQGTLIGVKYPAGA